MITRSKSRKNKNTQNNTQEVDNNMNTVTTSHDNQMEFDINNQLGDSQMLAHISMGNQESGTRGQMCIRDRSREGRRDCL